MAGGVPPELQNYHDLPVVVANPCNTLRLSSELVHTGEWKAAGATTTTARPI
jgi:hypothetical protein